MQMRRCLDVNGEPISASFRKSGYMAHWFVDHQVYVERQIRDTPQASHHRGANGDIRHKVAVHHVYVDIVGTGGLGPFDCFGQVGKVGGEYGGSDFDVTIHQTCIIHRNGKKIKDIILLSEQVELYLL